MLEKGVSEPSLSRALVMEWGQLRENEYKTTSGSRFSVIRQFGLFLLSLDIEAYLPSNYSYRSKSKTHVLSDDEIIAVFRIIDQRHPVRTNSDFQRLSLEYRIILRLILLRPLNHNTNFSTHTAECTLGFCGQTVSSLFQDASGACA